MQSLAVTSPLRQEVGAKRTMRDFSDMETLSSKSISFIALVRSMAVTRSIIAKAFALLITSAGGSTAFQTLKMAERLGANPGDGSWIMSALTRMNVFRGHSVMTKTDTLSGIGIARNI